MKHANDAPSRTAKAESQKPALFSCRSKTTRPRNIAKPIHERAQIESMPDQTLKMRGRLIPAHQIPVRTTDTEKFTSELKATLSKAPQLFLQAPCVLDISDLESSVSLEDIEHQINACRDSGLVPFAITSQSTAHRPLASQLKIGLVRS